jgi:AAA+ superfamily predicted ATPase
MPNRRAKPKRVHGRTSRTGLAADLARIAAILERHAADPEAGKGTTKAPPETERPEDAEDAPLGLLCRTFGLTPFERDVLLLCAGVELDADCAAQVARLQEGAPPTFALALAALPEAHWSALLPTGPLRYWRLVELGAGPSLVGSALRIDERILHYLLGLQFLDQRLAGIVGVAGPAAELVPSHEALAERIAAVWQAPGAQDGAPPPVQLCGGDPTARRDIAAAACALAGCALLVLHARDLPDGEEPFEQLQRLWEREALLVVGARMIVADLPDGADKAAERRVERLIERAEGLLILSSAARRPPGARTMLTLEVAKPPPSDQLALWRQALGDAAVDEADLRTLAYQFDVDLAAIRAASADALGTAPGGDGAALARALWDSCRGQARARVEKGVECIAPRACWDDLVLPERQRQLLGAIVDQIRHRPTVYGDWGFSDKTMRGLGLAALFAGPSGTGKTLAAEVIAAELSLDLMRIDLSAVVDKYIGETEKNLSRVFDAAEAGGAVLLFDEADALFGKRGEVKDSHDRYANIEVDYLLQRIDAYRGLAILATNLKDNLDQAFLRRLRFIVQFPFPDAAQRARIWERVFPPQTPLENLDFARLAQLNVAGGSIRNIALNAAFQAAADGSGVSMAQIRASARTEYAKLEKPLTDAETRGWE